jgi:hypothetical protein
MTSRGGLRRAGGWPDGHQKMRLLLCCVFVEERETRERLRVDGIFLLTLCKLFNENVSTYLDFRFTTIVCFSLVHVFLSWERREKKYFVAGERREKKYSAAGEKNILWRKRISCSFCICDASQKNF